MGWVSGALAKQAAMSRALSSCWLNAVKSHWNPKFRPQSSIFSPMGTWKKSTPQSSASASVGCLVGSTAGPNFRHCLPVCRQIRQTLPETFNSTFNSTSANTASTPPVQLQPPPVPRSVCRLCPRDPHYHRGLHYSSGLPDSSIPPRLPAEAHRVDQDAI